MMFETAGFAATTHWPLVLFADVTEQAKDRHPVPSRNAKQPLPAYRLPAEGTNGTGIADALIAAPTQTPIHQPPWSAKADSSESVVEVKFNRRGGRASCRSSSGVDQIRCGPRAKGPAGSSCTNGLGIADLAAAGGGNSGLWPIARSPVQMRSSTS